MSFFGCPRRHAVSTTEGVAAEAPTAAASPAAFWGWLESIRKFFTPAEAEASTPASSVSVICSRTQKVLYPLTPLVVGLASALARKAPFYKEVVGAVVMLDVALIVNAYDKMTARDWGHLFLKAGTGFLSALLLSLALGQAILPEVMVLGLTSAITWQLGREFKRRRATGEYLSPPVTLSTELMLIFTLVSAALGAFTYLNPSATGSPPLIEGLNAYWISTFAIQALILMATALKMALTARGHQPSSKAIKALDTGLGVLPAATNIQSILLFATQAGLFAARKGASVPASASIAISAVSIVIGAVLSYFLPPVEFSLMARYRALTSTSSAPVRPQSTRASRFAYCQTLTRKALMITLDTGASLSGIIQAKNLLAVAYAPLRTPEATLLTAVLLGVLGFLGHLHYHALKESPRLSARAHTIGTRLRQGAVGVDIFANTAYTGTFAYGAFALYHQEAVSKMIADGKLPISGLFNGALIVAAAAIAATSASADRVVEKGGRQRASQSLTTGPADPAPVVVSVGGSSTGDAKAVAAPASTATASPEDKSSPDSTRPPSQRRMRVLALRQAPRLTSATTAAAPVSAPAETINPLRTILTRQPAQRDLTPALGVGT